MRKSGFSLIELVVVMGVMALTAAIAGPAIFEALSPESRLKDRTGDLYSDIVFAQNEAVRQGAYNLQIVTGGGGGSTLRQRRVFFVFEPPNSYSIWRWEDKDGDNVRDAGEFNPDLDPNGDGTAADDAPVKEVEVDQAGRFEYGFPTENPYEDQCPSGINRTACGDDPGVPSMEITFSMNSCTLPIAPCNDNPEAKAIEFDSNGFIGRNGAVYITNNKYAYAISGNGAGLFYRCMWRYVPDNPVTPLNEAGCHWIPMH